MTIFKNHASVAKPAKGRSASALRSAIEALESRTLLTSVVVNNATDTTTGAGVVTLRDAINIANNSTTPTTITFSSTVFAKAQTITLNGTELELSNTKEATTITGPAAGLTVSGNKKSRVFQIDSGVSAAISGLVITDGNDAGGGGINNAGTLKLRNATVSKNTSSAASGGINNSGTATLTDVVVSGNIAADSSSFGGIGSSGTMTLIDVTVSDNTATLNDAGIWNGGVMTMTNVTVSGNKSDGFVGGIKNEGGGTLTGTDITVSGNTAAATGAGGIDNHSGGVMTLTNATVSGNRTVGIGGGIVNSGTLKLVDSTVSGNIADNGGGIYSGNLPTVSNTIVAGNSVTSGGTGPDVDGTFNSLGYNLVGKTDGSTGWTTHDLTGTIAKPLNADLGKLANNGGLTQTMLPLTGSPAIDHGSNALIPKGITTDQRGLARIVHTTVDIGAVEVQPSIVITAPAKQSATQGKSVSVALGSFTQFAGTTPYKLDINWGDGSADTIVTLSAAGTIPATAHAFAKAGSLTVSETITDKNNVKSNTATFTDVVTPVTGSIAGRVFNDANGDGKVDDGELGLDGWTVDLSLGGKVVQTTTTNISGDFSFTGLAAGTYVVTIVQISGAKATKPTGGTLTLTLTAGQNSTGNLFGEEAT